MVCSSSRQGVGGIERSLIPGVGDIEGTLISGVGGIEGVFDTGQFSCVKIFTRSVSRSKHFFSGAN